MNRDEAIHYLTHDPETGEYTGDLSVPCSRWGRNGHECAMVAYDLDSIVSDATGEGPTTDTLEHAMSMVVNDHDDVAYMFREYGSDAIREDYADELATYDDENDECSTRIARFTGQVVCTRCAPDCEHYICTHEDE